MAQSFYEEHKENIKEIENLKSEKISNKIIRSENEELKALIEDYSLTTDKILAKVIVDHNSPFLKSIIINKGSKDNIKIGTNVYDQSYLVGRVIEVNYKTSRVLLLSDLNSNIPVSIVPQNIQAIVTGTGGNHGEVKYIKDISSVTFEDESIIYTSGTGAIFKSGTPIGKIKNIEDQSNSKFLVEFFSDFSQLKYVFAEVIAKTDIKNLEKKQSENTNPINAKIKILEDEVEIIEDSNLKFKKENENLKIEINDLNNQVLTLNNTLSEQLEKINQFDIDKDELEYLRLNLIYSHKCQTRKLFSTGYKVGTPEYKECILRKGRKIND